MERPPQSMRCAFEVPVELSCDGSVWNNAEYVIAGKLWYLQKCREVRYWDGENRRFSVAVDSVALLVLEITGYGQGLRSKVHTQSGSGPEQQGAA
jgi:hypothetical protein